MNWKRNYENLPVFLAKFSMSFIITFYMYIWYANSCQTQLRTYEITVSTVSLILPFKWPMLLIFTLHIIFLCILIHKSSRVRSRDRSCQGFEPLLPKQCPGKCSFKLPWTIFGQAGTIPQIEDSSRAIFLLDEAKNERYCWVRNSRLEWDKNLNADET